MPSIMLRTPAVAGMFYPGDQKNLRELVQRYLDSVDTEPAPDRVVSVLVPHAGYRYSGLTAAHAFKRVLGKKVNRAIIVGCSHHFRISQCSIVTLGAFQTPMGESPIDTTFAEALASRFESSTLEAHTPEHSLEVQLPFLIQVLGNVPIVPILFGAQVTDWHAHVGECLAEMADDSDLLIVSTDLSHYLNEAAANVIDKYSLETLLKKDVHGFRHAIEQGSCTMCGAAAVGCGMSYALAKGATDWSVLDYRTSADASGDHGRVVGYASVSMERPA